MPIYNQEQILTIYRRFLEVREVDDVIINWSPVRGGINSYNVDEMERQLEEFIKENQTNYQIKADIKNNKTIQIDDKMWYIAVLQRGLDEGLTGEQEEELNPMCMGSAALFGIMVSGLIFAFENEAVRDWAVLCLNENRIYHLPKTFPDCIICDKKCETKHGNNPYPLGVGGRCCNTCNVEVVEAIAEGYVRCNDLKDDGDKRNILKACKLIFEDKLEKYHENIDEKDVDGSITRNVSKDEIFVEYKKIYDACKGYVAERLERHIRVRSITDPKSLTFGIDTLIEEEYQKLMIYLKALAEERKAKITLIITNLIETDTVSDVSTDSFLEKKKVKQVQEKSRTKDANKQQDNKKKQRAEFNRQCELAEKARQEQQKKKQQKKK